MLLCVIGAGVYLTVTMLFKISSIQVQTADGVVQEAGGYTSDQILQALDVHLEENIFSFDPGSKAAAYGTALMGVHGLALLLGSIFALSPLAVVSMSFYPMALALAAIIAVFIKHQVRGDADSRQVA
mgnify:CR=1 FL=1